MLSRNANLTGMYSQSSGSFRIRIIIDWFSITGIEDVFVLKMKIYASFAVDQSINTGVVELAAARAG